MSDTERDSGWSEQYAETGGWPPPAEDQRSYGPGTPPADPSGAAPEQPTDATAGQWSHPAAPAGQPDGGGQARPGQGGQPADSGGQTQLGQAGGQAGSAGSPPGRWGQQPDPAVDQAGQWGEPTDQTSGGYAQPGQWGQPTDQTGGGGYAQPGHWGPPADQATGWGAPTNQAETASYGQPAEAWAPGDPAYGRLGKQTPPPPPQQRPRRPWDGRPAPARSRPGGTAVVTITLIAICVVVYLIQQANPAFTARYALIPFAVEQGQYARLITSAFLHASVLHLATNMITLYIVGAPLERVLRPVRYLIVYFLSALGGSLFSVWLSPEFSIGVGASGAIFGLFGALLVLRRQVGAEAGALAVLIGLNLVISFTLPNISWQAHIGGLVTGTLVALALRGVDRISRRPAT